MLLSFIPRNLRGLPTSMFLIVCFTGRAISSQFLIVCFTGWAISSQFLIVCFTGRAISSQFVIVCFIGRAFSRAFIFKTPHVQNIVSALLDCLETHSLSHVFIVGQHPLYVSLASCLVLFSGLPTFVLWFGIKYTVRRWPGSTHHVTWTQRTG